MFKLKLSIIIPVYQALDQKVERKLLELKKSSVSRNWKSLQILLSGEINDFSKEFDYHEVKTTSRGIRLNEGAKKANGDVFLFWHPRSILDESSLNELSLVLQKDLDVWGAFTHSFDKQDKVLQWTSFYSNFIRGKGRGIYYLDHCLFCSKSLFERSHGFGRADIFEDTVFCQNYNKIKPPLLLHSISTTSSIRFKKNGILRQIILNQMMKTGFYLGLSDKTLNSIYEKGLNLNNKVWP